jgi:ferredoxin-NADP reductase/MOSC domain-containing protein YiiM/ferredoxin
MGSAGRLVSVNVGLPKDVAWHGRTVHTGIWKNPVTGPRMVRRGNIDGDGQGDLAGHGGEMRAVMVYQLSSYRYWEKELGREDFVHGQFGENFTVEGLPDDEVCVGDRYRVGNAVFEVTQPRVTCYRVGLRMDEPRMPALLVSHGRPGFYLRVIEEGEVEAGQDIVKVVDGPGRMTVADVDALLYRPGHHPDRMAAALRIDALSPGWRASFEAMLRRPDRPDGGSGNAGLTGEDAAPPPAWPGFRPLTVTRVQQESRSISSFWLADPGGEPLPAAAPGQYLTVRLDAGPGLPALVRSYSLSGQPGASRYRISVKREARGAASALLHTRVTVGDELQAAAPRGTFILTALDTGTDPDAGTDPVGHQGAGGGAAADTAARAPIVLASAGVGATPVLAMLRALADARSAREVWWLHGARDGAEHAFADESRQLLGRLPRGVARICYSHPRPEDRKGVDYTDTGHLDAGLLADLHLSADAEAYLCGPTAFMADVTAALTGRGLAPARIRSEAFGAGPAITPGIVGAAAAGPPHAPAGEPGTGPAVTFVRSGLTVPWKPEYGSVLEMAEACDVPVRWSCRTGVCHTCVTGVLSGEVAYDPEPVERPAAGSALICCSRPARDTVVDL